MSQTITRVFLVRHGSTTLAAEDRFAGATNVDLSEEGRAQAKSLGTRLTNEKIGAFYASPMQRARDTAQFLAAPHQLTVEVRDGLREISHGRWEEMTRTEVEQQFPDEAAAWEEDPYTFAPAGGESGLAVTARALPLLLDLLRAHLGETIVVVSHKATIRLLVAALLGFDPRRYRDNLDLAPASLTIVDFKHPARARLTLFNDTSHYSAVPLAPGAHLSKTWNAGG